MKILLKIILEIVANCYYIIFWIPLTTRPGSGFGKEMAMQTVKIQGKFFAWSEEEGLEQAAILTLQPWIKKTAMRYLPKALALNLELEDLMQAGNVGALNAAKSFRPDSDASFLTWANFRIVDEMQRLCRQRAAVSIDACPYEDDEMTPLSERMADPSDQAAGADAAIQASQLMSVLSKDEQKVVRLYFGLGGSGQAMPLEAIGIAYGVSGQCVSNRVSAALEKMESVD
ncbi:MAG: sigma-70 family RNA polymerase sigma factor [Holophagales bacterium]|jgi:RNA polymerase sigma factor (sigma-70 family)|nr:sigma-70 family RNA polymerase sigma factor [Holophagales bacterium]